MPRHTAQMSESMSLAILLTLAGGFQDAYSYNCRGQVFANAQTGNIVLLGQNLATGNFSHALRYLFPLLAFFAGVYLTEWLRQKYRNIRRIHWRQILLLVEVILLLFAGGLPQSLNIFANVLLSFACAMQVAGFRKFRGIPCATTMCIGNMRSAAECLCQYHVTKNREAGRQSLHYILILLIFAVGAAMGAVLSHFLGNLSIWIAALFQLAGFVLMFIREDIKDSGRK